MTRATSGGSPGPDSNTPWLQDPDVTLHHGDVLATLHELPAESVDCVVTSPPYWGLRDYGTAKWEGGDENCDHTVTGEKRKFTNGRGEGVDDEYAGTNLTSWTYRDATPKATCPKCGAHRVDGQLGLEPTPEQYVERMVEVFREVRRVLATHGTVWLNLGDSYAGGGAAGTRPDPNAKQMTNAGSAALVGAPNPVPPGLKQKDLCGIPWRVAFALQADGWYLRSDIIWSKPNPMPESVTDRPTKAHEYVFLLSKQPRYFFDQEAVREKPVAVNAPARNGNTKGTDGVSKPDFLASGYYDPTAGRNIRSVWEIATQPYPEAHFATFPEELARRCIAAGCPEQVCRVCGKARERVVERGELVPAGNAHGNGLSASQKNSFPEQAGFMRYKRGAHSFTDCGHSDYRPGIVLDPFMGSGTVAYVARKLGRHAVGIDLNAEYLELAARRLQQQSLFAETA